MTMQIHGLVMSAALEENPPGGDEVEMVLRVQGVGPGQPRRIVIPFRFLLQEPDLEPELIERRAFEAEIEPEGPDRWVVTRIAFAGVVLRPRDA